jgi:hypothetical protein
MKYVEFYTQLLFSIQFYVKLTEQNADHERNYLSS